MCYRSWQDIVVGAPQYFEKDGEIGGAVYVYINKDGKWDQVKPTRIDGPMDSMFGLAVENLGDINQDGYQGTTCGWVTVSLFSILFCSVMFKKCEGNTNYCHSFFCLHIANLLKLHVTLRYNRVRWSFCQTLQLELRMMTRAQGTFISTTVQKRASALPKPRRYFK